MLGLQTYGEMAGAGSSHARDYCPDIEQVCCCTAGLVHAVYAKSPLHVSRLSVLMPLEASLQGGSLDGRLLHCKEAMSGGWLLGGGLCLVCGLSGSQCGYGQWQ